ncbi:hypothetical protein EXIGLDRAFT_842219 [Exidia glandulosa HHB12029]|uniref:F-box domain-containing protein n=1 Tax=Exidia glandulosa HHB12029 TaxID=1314781 RepID=A0A165DF57_EXIGL|nr:hypothetical protein EXIGLDRAFT_842219 [Exidia glandulosa HHB12029]
MSPTAEDESLALLLDGERIVLRELEAQAERALKDRAAATEKVRAATAAFFAAANAVDRTQDVLARVRGALASVERPCNSAPTTSSRPRVLNDDVLAEIFKFYANSVVGTTSAEAVDDGAHGIQSPFTVASVSRQWRAAALATPSIWTVVEIYYNTDNLDDYLTMMIERSGTLSLDLKAMQVPLKDRAESPMRDSNLGFVLRRARKIDIDFSGDEFHFPTSFLALFQAPMPLLERVVLRFPLESNGVIHYQQGTRLFTLCPRLSDLGIDTLPVEYIRPCTLPDLRRFSVQRRISDEELIALCQAWPNLETLRVATISHSAHHPQLQPLLLPRLRKLHCTRPKGPLRLLPGAMTPALSDLSLVCTPASFTDMRGFIGLSPLASLTKLTLATDDEGLFPTLLPSLPNVASLTLTRFSSEGAVNFLTYWTEYAPLHPQRLASLEICDTAFNADVLQALVSFVTLRHEAAVPNTAHALQSLLIVNPSAGDVFGNYAIPPWITSRLQQLVLNVHIDSGTSADWEL